ncbi:MAG: PEP-CTERM sorting domain-containing protein [Pseudomonadota bacterium]
MKQITLAIALALGAAGAAQAASINGLVNTGVGTSGSEDSHYALSVVQGATVLSSEHGFITQDNSWPINPWLANSATSRWITPTANQGESFDAGSAGVYRFQLQFDLTGYNAASANFMGRFAADNEATVVFNGTQIAVGSSFSAWSGFGAGTGFNQGINVLDFYVTNWQQNGGNPLGLRVEFSDATVAAVPEPSSYAMLLAGLGMVGWMARRRRVG